MFRTSTLLSAALAASLGLASAAAFADDLDIDKVNGDISVQGGQAYDDISTVNGDIRIDSGARVDEVTTVNGSIDVASNATITEMTTVNGGIHLDDGAQVGGDIGTVNGEIFVGRGGEVGGDITTVNGSIGLVDTDLAGGISTVNGDITVGVGSHVRGGITVEKSNNWDWLPISFGKPKPLRIVIGPHARVDGPLHFERAVKLFVHDTATIGEVSGATAVPYSSARAPRDG